MGGPVGLAGSAAAAGLAAPAWMPVRISVASLWAVAVLPWTGPATTAPARAVLVGPASGGMPVVALLAGLAAGLAVAVPLGAIGVLIVQEGLARGWTVAAAAATGVALVDLGYAVVAVAGGRGVSHLLTGHVRAVQVAGALVLAGVAVHGLAALRTGSPASSLEPPAGGSRDEAGQPSAARTVGRFVAMTAVNPLTAVYFMVLATGLGATVAGWTAEVAFVTGVFVGSWSWQLLLAGTGSVAGARLPGWARTATGAFGYLLVMGYAIRLAVG